MNIIPNETLLIDSPELSIKRYEDDTYFIVYLHKFKDIGYRDLYIENPKHLHGALLHIAKWIKNKNYDGHI